MPSLLDQVFDEPATPKSKGSVLDQVYGEEPDQTKTATTPARSDIPQMSSPRFDLSIIAAPMERGPSEWVDPSMSLADIISGRGGSAESAANVFRTVGASTSKGVGYAGNVARGFITDLVNQVSGGPGYAENLDAALRGGEMPVDVLNREIAKEHPNVATAAMTAQGVAATAPLLLAGGLPSLAQRAVALGFTAQMVANVKHLATDYGTELGKPPEQRDQAKLAQLRSDLIQTGVFAPLAGAYGARPAPPKPPMQGPLATGAVLPIGSGALPSLKEAPGPFIPEPTALKTKPVVPGTPAESRESETESVRALESQLGRKPYRAEIQDLFETPNHRMSKEDAAAVLKRIYGETQPTTGEQNAEAIRGDQGQLRTPGQVAETSQEARGHDVEQKPPGQPQPVVAGETTPPEAQAGSLPLTAVPAIKTGDTITTGTHHVDAYQRAREAGIADTSGSQEGFLDNGVFKTREQYAADHPEVPTTVEQGKTHSEDLAKAKTEPTAVDKTIAEKVFSQQYPEDLTRAGIPSGKINSTEGAMGALINELRRSDKPVEVINAWAKMWKSMQARQKTLKTAIETDPKSLIEYMGMGFKTQLPREALENIADFGQREFPPEVVQAAQKALGRKTKQPVKPVSTSPAPSEKPAAPAQEG